MSKQEPRYINRELSWLEFNQRVLDEGRDPTVPILERLKFLAITSSNLDEFFMVRVGGLQLLAERSGSRTDPVGMTAAEQLAAISQRTHRMTADQYRCYLDEIEPALDEAGIRRLRIGELSERQTNALQRIFDEELFGILTPMVVEQDETFPLLAHDSLNLFIRLKLKNDDPDDSHEDSRFVVIPFGPSASRFLRLPSDGGYEYILLEDAVAANIESFFPGEEIIECVPFRITRNADLALRDDFTADVLAEMEQVLRARKESACVRLEIVDAVTTRSLEFLRSTLDVREENIYALPGPLDLSAYFRLTGLPGFESLRYEDWPPQTPPRLDPSSSMFEVIREGDVLLCHPYESFDPVVRLIEEAASDSDVLAIKQTLYRTSRNSPIVKALMRAAENGKSVAVIVELKARFDEARNIEWARSLERAGVQVIYGVKGLKTHAKLCVIIRREAQGIRRYAHFSTGNYNENTARLYTDISLMTCQKELTADATSFFNAITGYTQPQRFQTLEAAPLGLRDRLLELINGETERCKQGQKAGITAKLNSLVDPEIIDALYAASAAGVPIRLNVRGICCLRPGVKGLSKNIKVVSVIDRLLEHSRIIHFQHGGDDLVFISSADWMPRNLDRRIELLVPVEEPALRERLLEILEFSFRDNMKSRKILPDGTFRSAKRPEDPSKQFRSQQRLYEFICEEIKQATETGRTVFVPHRAPVEED
ncbi:MAG: polyphosphate kinase 1 [Planctomycetaceae bacterium]